MTLVAAVFATSQTDRDHGGISRCVDQRHAQPVRSFSMFLVFCLLAAIVSVGCLLLAFRWYHSDAAFDRREARKRISPQYRRW
jgi:hypothetical protein